MHTNINEQDNINNQNILFLDYLKNEKSNKKNNIQHKPPITIALNRNENNPPNNPFSWRSSKCPNSKCTNQKN